VPLGQTEGQRILQALHIDIENVAAAAVAAPQDLHSSAFGADMAAMRHEDLEVRIFKT
jgi:urease accessory protein